MHAAQSPNRVLCISWDHSLATTRELLLRHAGYQVIAALGEREAMKSCVEDADLMVMGHSVPRPFKEVFITAFQLHSKAPILSLLRFGQEKLPRATIGVVLDGPQDFLRAVKDLLQSQRPE